MTSAAAQEWLRSYHGSIDSTALLLAFDAGARSVGYDEGRSGDPRGVLAAAVLDSDAVARPHGEEDTMSVEARFYVEQVTRHVSIEGVIVTLKASMKGEANKAWSKFTPSGKIELTVSSAEAADWFNDHLGKDVSIMFSEVEE